MRNHYPQDPRWIVARYAGTCPDCKISISPGERVYYFPQGKHTYCTLCGEARSREFESAAADEWLMANGRA